MINNVITGSVHDLDELVYKFLAFKEDNPEMDDYKVYIHSDTSPCGTECRTELSLCAYPKDRRKRRK